MALRHRRNRDHQRLAPAARRRLHDRAGAARRDRRADARRRRRRPTRSPSPTASTAGRCGPRSIPRCRSCSAAAAGASCRMATPRSCASTGRSMPLAQPPAARRSQEPRALAAAQSRYQAAEAEKLATRPWSELSWADRLRCTRVLGPIAVAVHCLFVKGLIFDGTAGSSLYRPARDRRPDPLHAPAAPRPRPPMPASSR